MLRARRFMHEHVQVSQWSGILTTVIFGNAALWDCPIRDIGDLGRQHEIAPQGTIQGSTSNRLCLKHDRNCNHMALYADSLVRRPTPMGRTWLHECYHFLDNA